MYSCCIIYRGEKQLNSQKKKHSNIQNTEIPHCKSLNVVEIFFAFQHLKGEYKQEGEQMFMKVDTDRTRGNGSKLRQGRFRLDVRRKFFTRRVVTH